MKHRLAVAILVATAAAAAAQAAPAVSMRDALLPPPGRILTGVTGGSASAFAQAVGKHPAVYGFFTHWGSPFGYMLTDADAINSRLMIHLSTTLGYGIPPVISTRGIAAGRGDGYVLSLAQALAARGRPTYLRLMPEANQANNPYAAFNQDGSPRPDGTRDFKQAFRRTVLLLRGGPVSALNARLRALGMPAVRGAQTDPLPHAPVAILWVPQVAGTPDIPANSAAAYYPGGRYVDWVGTDFYSLYPNFTGLERFYNEYPNKPFVFGEWALWGGDDPAWVRQLFDFVRSHRRVQMMVYNQGLRDSGPFRLYRFPAGRREIRRQLADPRFLAYAPAP